MSLQRLVLVFVKRREKLLSLAGGTASHWLVM